jgi:hypothetical protein
MLSSTLTPALILEEQDIHYCLVMNFHPREQVVKLGSRTRGLHLMIFLLA